MKTIGFTGGGSICELGTVADVQFFFDCIDKYAMDEDPAKDWTLLTDRLYKRYLRYDQLDHASELMCRVKNSFSATSSSVLDWDSRVEKSATRLPLSCPTLAGVFATYFQHFAHCVESARLSQEGTLAYPGYGYQPVRIIIADEPWAMADEQRPLSEYDTLAGLPFWVL